MTATTRQDAVQFISNDAALEHRVQAPKSDEARLPDYYGINVFNDQVQRSRLPGPVYEALHATIESGAALPPDIADAVASAMKDWAIERGATHYTHWFQPMTGLTAEKHDSFLQPTSGGRAILEFSGGQLVQGEPDASSFPSGGLRATFEARGYTAWDPTSPAFLRTTADGATLTIPTAFCSWTGEALDKKTPLLRSCEAISKSSVRLLQLIGESQITRVGPTAGAEQEYFLIDTQFAVLRPDLMSCGRTLFGARPHKGQEFDDHYFGAINRRALSFMMELERELWMLGVPVKTRHNEVAPSQFELAPVFSNISVAADQNMLTMEVMADVADRHGMRLLLHEKPFAGLNGSGKHLNWSLSDNLGNNLLTPGHSPHENLKFILFLTAVLSAVDEHQDLLRASIASAGNDHRLGANEAPPAIMSVFMGTQLEAVLDAIIEGRPYEGNHSTDPIRLGVTALPNLPRDVADRNRTSPFAFTGNKFEFRAVASSQSVAYPATLLNLIVAEALDQISDAIEKRGGPSTENIQSVVREVLSQHKRILFGGDNYGAEWQAEAERRGLLNKRTTPEALETFASDRNVDLYERYGVFTRGEAVSRAHVMNEKYWRDLNVEAIT
ncbi:MAG: glutamine synthetase, partial [Planctomycetota bacterium]